MDRFRKVMAIPMGLTALALVWLVKQLGGEWFASIASIVVLGMLLALAVVGRLQRLGKVAWSAFALILMPFAIFGAFALPSSYSAQASRTASSILKPQAFSADALAKARASGQPVFVWFTADWCVTCKVNEQVALEREATRAAFEKAGVIAMVGDWTRRDGAISVFLTEHGAAGVPFYMWYEPGKEGEVLPQVLTVDMLSQLAGRSRPGTAR
jgi:thiol:disulfide interchange protein